MHKHFSPLFISHTAVLSLKKFCISCITETCSLKKAIILNVLRAFIWRGLHSTVERALDR